MNMLLASFLAMTLGLQSGGPFEMRKSVIAAGGDTVQSTASGSDYLLSSTTGQAHTTTGQAGPFQLTGGFWAGLEGAAIFIDGFESSISPTRQLRAGAPDRSDGAGDAPDRP